jgi:hypothetical protein
MNKLNRADELITHLGLESYSQGTGHFVRTYTCDDETNSGAPLFVENG